MTYLETPLIVMLVIYFNAQMLFRISECNSYANTDKLCKTEQSIANFMD